MDIIFTHNNISKILSYPDDTYIDDNYNFPEVNDKLFSPGSVYNIEKGYHIREDIVKIGNKYFIPVIKTLNGLTGTVYYSLSIPIITHYIGVGNYIVFFATLISDKIDSHDIIIGADLLEKYINQHENEIQNIISEIFEQLINEKIKMVNYYHNF